MTISVIMPIYNAANTLNRAVDSVIAQTFADLELILVDDGSTDASTAICAEYAERDHRIRVIHQENKGQGAARNVGLALATGEFIGFADSDDYLLPDMYETLAASFSDEYDAVKCGAYLINDSDFEPPYPLQEAELRVDKIVGRYMYAEQVISGEEILSSLAVNLLDNSLWSLLLRASACRGITFNNGKRMEDSYYYMDIATRIRALRLLSPCSYIYLLRDDSLSHSPELSTLLWERSHHDMTLFERLSGAADYYKSAVFNRFVDSLAGYCAERQNQVPAEQIPDFQELVKFFNRYQAVYYDAQHPIHQENDPFDVKTYLTEGKPLTFVDLRYGNLYH